MRYCIAITKGTEIMTNKEMKQQIEQTAKAAYEAGQSIEINRSLPYVAIETSQESYFFQEHEASELLDEAEKASEKFDVSVADYILWRAQSW